MIQNYIHEEIQEFLMDKHTHRGVYARH